MEAKESGRHSTQGPAERLLEVADRLFYERGYSATGVNELMKVAGVAKASFYHHFPSKTDLIVAYLDQRAQAWQLSLEQEVSQHSEPRRRVLALFDFLENWMVSCDYRGCAFLNTVAEFPDLASAPRASVAAAKKGLRQYITRLCADAGHQDAGDEVFLLFEGATSQASAIGEAWPAQAARRTVESRI